MESISQFTYCEKIQTTVTPDGKISKQYITPLTEISPAFFPTHYSFAIAFTISNIKPDQTNNLELTFQDPLGEKVESLSIEHCTPPPEIIKPDKERYSTTVEVELTNVVLKRPGTYTTKIAFNHREIGSFGLDILLKSEKAEKN